MKFIRNAIGPGEINDRSDLLVIQELINLNLHHLPSLNPLPLTGSLDWQTSMAIKRFQQEVLRLQGTNMIGRIKPGDTTLRGLSAGASPSTVKEHLSNQGYLNRVVAGISPDAVSFTLFKERIKQQINPPGTGRVGSSQAVWIGSPNKRVGRRGYKPEAIVIHIMEGSLAGTDSWFRQSVSKVSAHYGIGKQGEIHQYVSESDTAWHAGRVSNPTWKGIKSKVNPNLYTIGIEHEGKAHTFWSDAMYQASANLIKEICQRWKIPIDRTHIIGHREIFSGKTCPGSEVSFEKLIQLAQK